MKGRIQVGSIAVVMGANIYGFALIFTEQL